MTLAQHAQKHQFQMMLFYRDEISAIAADKAGIDGFVVDFEHARKADRQYGFDTEINRHDINTLEILRDLTDKHLLCRVDHSEAIDQAQIDRVIAAGANEVIVPMVRTFDQAAKVVDLCSGRVKITIMVETPEAVELASDFSKLAIDRIYVGLNDLHILRRTEHIFNAIRDGTLDQIRSMVDGVEFGYGGLTLPDRGVPLKSRHLYNDMARLNCDFTFLRRSFYRDVEVGEMPSALAKMRAVIERARARAHAEQTQDHGNMISALEQLVFPVRG